MTTAYPADMPETYPAQRGSMTEERVRDLLALLPTAMVADLAKGPTEDPEECRFCEVFDDWLFAGTPGRWVGDVMKGTEHLVQSPKQRRQAKAWAALHDWHQGWEMYGAIPNSGRLLGRTEECYRRCLIIYRAAGWTG